MTQAVMDLDRRSGITPRRVPVAPNAVIGMLIFVVAEVMFFAALMSAFTITKISTLGPWPPPGQPRLPIEATAVNTGVLLASGIALFFARRQHALVPRKALRLLGASALLGATFVTVQGYEWVQLIREGLTLRSGPHGGFFYLIVGAHALHVLAGLMVLGLALRKLQRDELSPGYFAATRVFWYFVVLLWPIVYFRVYL